MDLLVKLFENVYFPIFHEFSVLFDNDNILVFATLLLIVILTYVFKEKVNLPLLLITLLLSTTMSVLVKDWVGAPRPCTMGIESKVDCPVDSYAFPSSHAVIGFSLLISTLGKLSFPFYLVFSVLLALSRVYLGVHSYFDVAGSLVLSFIGYLIARILLVKLRAIPYEKRI